MTVGAAPSKLIQRYLKILHLNQQVPSLEYLQKLVQAQLQYVPYENISKVLRFKEQKLNIPDFEEFIELNEEFGFGGTCFVQNGYFVELLNGLGFHAEIIGVGVDPESPTHPTCRVRVDAKSYIVDLGNFSTFAGPFSLELGTSIESTGGEWTYTYQALPDLTHQMLSKRGEEKGRTHRSHPPVRDLSFFAPAIQKSFGKETIFMNTVVCHRMLSGSAVYQWGPTLVKVEGGENKKSKIADIADLERVYRDVLGVPKFPVREALEVLREFNGVNVW